MNGGNFRPNIEMAKHDGDGSREQNAQIGAVALKTEVPEKTKADLFLRRHGRELALFSRDSKLTFVPSTSADTFAFYPKEFKVETPLSWFANEKYNDDELNFANHHEIAHFIDMKKNPEAYLENFKHMEQKAEELAKGYLAKHPDKASLDAVKKFYYGELHSLYNVLDDIYVNNLVLQRNKFFGSGDGRDDVATLYEKAGFEKADQTKQPLHRQMIYSLLRDEMLGKIHGKSVVDERVEGILGKKKLGKTVREIIDKELKPRQGILVDPAERYKKIQVLIEPEYLKLLEASLDEQREKEKQNEEQQGEQEEQRNQGEQGEDRNGGQQGEQSENGDSGDGQQGEQSENGDSGDEFNPFNDKKGGQKQPDILDHGENNDQVVKDILEGLKEADKIDKMSPEEREKYLSEKRTREFDEQHGITQKERAENDRIKTEITKARKEMRKFWQRLIGKSIEYRQTRIREQRKGRLNVGSYIRKYPEAIEAERKGDLRSLEVYDRNGLERLIVDQPETIDVTLLVDCSGSMDYSKVEAAKRAAALLMYSIKDFNDELERTRRETRSKLRANTEVLVFGSNFAEVKQFDKKSSYDNNDAAIIKSISEINGDRGGTNDAVPLGDILSRLTSDERAKIQQGKLKKIVFEITDGEPNNPELTSEWLNELAKAGVIVVGFQIGNVSEDERNTFRKIWASDGGDGNKQGIFIGTEIDKLPGSLMRALADSLNDIVI